MDAKTVLISFKETNSCSDDESRAESDKFESDGETE